MSLDPSTDVYFPSRAGNSDGVDVAHDAALIRASQSHHKIAKRTEKPRRTVFVWGMSHKTKEEEIKAFFTFFGEVRSVVLIRDIVTRISKGYAFVEFVSSKAAFKAIEGADGANFAGRPVRCQRKVGGVLKGWRPRRLGGGFGGLKESGQMRFGGRATPFSKKGIAAVEDSIRTVSSSEAGSAGPSNSKLDFSLGSTSSRGASYPSVPKPSILEKAASSNVEVRSRDDEKGANSTRKKQKQKKDKKKKRRKDDS